MNDIRIPLTLAAAAIVVVLAIALKPNVSTPAPTIRTSYECKRVSIAGFKVINLTIVDITSAPAREDKPTWYQCTSRFSDGSHFTRLGDAKP